MAAPQYSGLPARFQSLLAGTKSGNSSKSTSLTPNKEKENIEPDRLSFGITKKVALIAGGQITDGEKITEVTAKTLPILPVNIDLEPPGNATCFSGSSCSPQPMTIAKSPMNRMKQVQRPSHQSPVTPSFPLGRTPRHTLGLSPFTTQFSQTTHPTPPESNRNISDSLGSQISQVSESQSQSIATFSTGKTDYNHNITNQVAYMDTDTIVENMNTKYETIKEKYLPVRQSSDKALEDHYDDEDLIMYENELDNLKSDLEDMIVAVDDCTSAHILTADILSLNDPELSCKLKELKDNIEQLKKDYGVEVITNDLDQEGMDIS